MSVRVDQFRDPHLGCIYSYVNVYVCIYSYIHMRKGSQSFKTIARNSEYSALSRVLHTHAYVLHTFFLPPLPGKDVPSPSTHRPIQRNGWAQ